MNLLHVSLKSSVERFGNLYQFRREKHCHLLEQVKLPALWMPPFCTVFYALKSNLKNFGTHRQMFHLEIQAKAYSTVPLAKWSKLSSNMYQVHLSTPPNSRGLNSFLSIGLPYHLQMLNRNLRKSSSGARNQIQQLILIKSIANWMKWSCRWLPAYSFQTFMLSSCFTLEDPYYNHLFSSNSLQEVASKNIPNALIV